MKNKPRFPGWRFGPNGEAEIFQRAEDVPEGWTDTQSRPVKPVIDEDYLRSHPDEIYSVTPIARVEKELKPKRAYTKRK